MRSLINVSTGNIHPSDNPDESIRTTQRLPFARFSGAIDDLQQMSIRVDIYAPMSRILATRITVLHKHDLVLIENHLFHPMPFVPTSHRWGGSRDDTPGASPSRSTEPDEHRSGT
jgi:hypothetical protein